MLYSAVVKDGGRLVIIEDQEYPTKMAFIHDLRKNGYAVNPKKVKESKLFNYIMNHTDCYEWDWELTEIPKNEKWAGHARRHYSHIKENRGR